MQEAPKRGYLCKGFAQAKSNQILNLLPESLARMCGWTIDEFNSAWSELVEAGVPSRGEDGVWFCRRMVKDEELRKVRSEAGKKGGKASVESRFAQAKPKPNVGLDWIGNASVKEGGVGETNGDALVTQHNADIPFEDYKRALGTIFQRVETDAWSYIEENQFVAILKRPSVQKEIVEIQMAYRKRLQWLPQSLGRLLEDWTGTLDKARAGGQQNGNPKIKLTADQEMAVSRGEMKDPNYD